MTTAAPAVATAPRGGEPTDVIVLDVPVVSGAAQARAVGVAATHSVTIGGTTVQCGVTAELPASGVLAGAADLDGAANLADRRGLTLERTSGAAHAVPHGILLGYNGNNYRDSEPQSEIAGLDHVVLTSPNSDRIVADLCGRLGFDLRLDRLQPWGVHQLFFRRRELLVEVILQVGDDVDPAAQDTVWGIAWRTADIEVTHERLTAQHIPVSEIRRGAKPGTRVMTIRDPDLGVPTIVLEQAER